MLTVFGAIDGIQANCDVAPPVSYDYCVTIEDVRDFDFWKASYRLSYNSLT